MPAPPLLRDPNTAELDPISLRFLDPDLERQYRAASFDERRQALARGFFFTVLMIAAFGPVELFTFPMLVSRLWLLRYGLALPAILLLAPLYLSHRFDDLGRRYNAEIVAAAACWLYLCYAGMGAVVLSALGESALLLATCAYLLVVMTSYLLMQLPFLYCTAMGWSTVVLGCWIIVMTLDMSPSDLGLIAIMGIIANAVGMLGCYLVEEARRVNFLTLGRLEAERLRTRSLLLNTLPPSVAERLLADDTQIADSHDDVSVLFLDIVGFTSLSERIPPDQLVALLSEIFSTLDALVAHAGAEKIKTIGDAYMVAAGVPEAQADHAPRLARLALDARAAVARVQTPDGTPLGCRIGIHSGALVAGVIGQRKFAYDLWGDTVNLASRMESTAEPGRIQISEATRALLTEDFELAPRGPVFIRGKGELPTWWLIGPRAR